MPTKFSGRLTPAASSVIGSDEVLEPSTAPGSTMFSISANTLFFSSVFSNTASITKSTPVKSAASAVGVMRSSSARDFASVVRPFANAFCSRFSEYALPLRAACSVTSLRTTSMPAFAVTYAIPAPIMPAPRMPTLWIVRSGASAGRDVPLCTACRSKKNA